MQNDSFISNTNQKAASAAAQAGLMECGRHHRELWGEGMEELLHGGDIDRIQIYQQGAEQEMTAAAHRLIHRQVLFSSLHLPHVEGLDFLHETQAELILVRQRHTLYRQRQSHPVRHRLQRHRGDIEGGEERHVAASLESGTPLLTLSSSH